MLRTSAGRKERLAVNQFTDSSPAPQDQPENPASQPAPTEHPTKGQPALPEPSVDGQATPTKPPDDGRSASPNPDDFRDHFKPKAKVDINGRLGLFKEYDERKKLFVFLMKFDDHSPWVTNALTLGQALTAEAIYKAKEKEKRRKAKEGAATDAFETALRVNVLDGIDVHSPYEDMARKSREKFAEDPTLYTRGNQLCVVARVEEDDPEDAKPKVRRYRGTPTARILGPISIIAKLEKLLRFYKLGKYGPMPSRPPEALAKLLIEEQSYPGVRPLTHITDCPFVDLDGNLVGNEGYHRPTETLIVSSPVVKVPKNPTRQDAFRAATKFLGLFDKFPWQKPQDKLAFLAANLTSIQAPTIAGDMPGYLITSNDAGTGKTLLINSIGFVSRGGRIPSITPVSDRTEMDKILNTIALECMGAVNFDNIPNGSCFGNSALDSAMTSGGAKSGRILGTNTSIKDAYLHCLWCATGNNITLADDGSRRWLISNLLTEEETPFERVDLDPERDDLEKYILDRRGEILGLLLTILLAHARAGRPRHGKGRSGSFEEWDDMIRSAISWTFAGSGWEGLEDDEMDCLTTQREAMKEDSERLLDEALVTAWVEGFGCDRYGHTVADVIREVDSIEVAGAGGEPPPLWSVLMDIAQGDQKKIRQRLGDRLSSIQNKPVMGSPHGEVGKYRFVRSEKTKNGSAVWRIEPIRGPFDLPDV
jgi:hypothetical protein